MDTILVVDTDISEHEQQTAEWAKYGVGTVRVDTMHDAVSRLSHEEKYYFVAINEDSIPDFFSQLPIMRDITDTPIFIITSSYTTDKKVKAVELGADVYDPFSNYIKENVRGALALLKAQNRWANRPVKTDSLLIGGDIILSPSRRIVFVKDTEVTLTKLEFDVLRCLMAKSGHFMAHSDILQEVWGEDYSENGSEVLRRTMSRLRTKLAEVSPAHEYIKSERVVGYKFLG